MFIQIVERYIAQKRGTWTVYIDML